MSKSVEAKLKETEAAKVALEAEVTKLAGENDTYTNRMKQMEDNISQAMKRMAEMEQKMEEYAKMKATLDEKMVETEANLQEVIEKKEEEAQPVSGNTIEGVNPTVVTGQPKEDEKSAKKGKKAGDNKDEARPIHIHPLQPNGKSGEMPQFIKDKIEDAKDDEDEGEEEAKSMKKGKKAKKAEEAVEEAVAEEAPAKVAEVAAPTPVAEEIVKDVVEALINEKVGEVASKFAMAQSKFNELDAELIKAKETLALEAKVKEAAMATVAGLQAKYEALLAKVSGIESSSKTVEEKVAKTVANLGVEPVSAEVLAVESTKEKSAEELLAEFDSIEDAKTKRAFYKKHESVIVAAAFPKKR